MNASVDVVQRLAKLREESPALRLYALVDGAQYGQHRNEPLAARAGLRAPFEHTDDAALSHAGPWLVDAERVGEALTVDLAELEREAPAVTWLLAFQDLSGLSQLLQLKLDTRLPDGRTALLRFWDPRVLVGLTTLLNANQREAFFAHIYEWLLLHDDKRVWIGRQHADAE